MPATVNHSFTSPVADATGVVTYGNSTYNASALVKPSDWNSAHVVTFNAVGSEISGAFSNVVGGVSFGLETNGYITGGAPAGGGGITNINVSAGTQSANMSAITFADSNGLAFGLSSSVVTGSYSQSTHAHSSVVFSNSNNVSFGLNGSTVTATASFPAQSAFVLSNANGVSFGTNGSTVTATVKTDYLTTGAASDHSHGVTLNLTNISGTTGGNSVGINLSLSAAAQTAYQFTDGGGVSFGTNGSTVTATVRTDYIGASFSGTNISGTVGAAGLQLSVAAGGGGADGYNIMAAGSQTANTTGTVAFLNSNGITFGMSNNSQITASHNAVTSQSNPTLNDVQDLTADKTFFMNTRQLQFQWGSNLTAFATATNRQGLFEVDVIGATNFATESSLKVDVLHVHQSSNNPYLHLLHLQADGTNAIPLHIEQAGAVGMEINRPISFDGGSVPMILGTSQSNSVSNLNAHYLQDRASSYFAVSNHSHGNPTLALTNLTGTTASASNGFTLSLSAAAGGGGADGYNILAAGTQTAGTATTVNFANGNGITFGMSDSSQITASHNGLTQQSTQPAVGLNTALTANGVSWTVNSSGLSLNVPAFLTTAQPVGAYLTTARASNDAIGLNTALTANGLSVTANSSGLSINVPAWLTTAAQSNHSHGNPTLNLTNLSGTTASASNGLTLSLSAAAATGFNVVSLGTTGTTGTAWSSASATVGLNGSGAVTVSQNNSNQIVVAGPVLSYLVAGAGISLSSTSNSIYILTA